MKYICIKSNEWLKLYRVYDIIPGVYSDYVIRVEDEPTVSEFFTTTKNFEIFLSKQELSQYFKIYNRKEKLMRLLNDF